MKISPFAKLTDIVWKTKSTTSPTNIWDSLEISTLLVQLLYFLIVKALPKDAVIHEMEGSYNFCSQLAISPMWKNVEMKGFS